MVFIPLQACFSGKWKKIIGHVLRTVVRVDDILISGINDNDHLDNLEEVLRIMSESGLRLKKSKCVFMAPEVTYLVVSKDGVAPVNEKTDAIIKAPTPKDVTQVKSFLGMVNYYHRHLPNLADTLEPLHKLLPKPGSWHWGRPQQVAFEETKSLLSSADLLVHYDPNRKLILSCDASPYGLGAVLSHVMDDGSERPVAFASRSMSAAERNYAQIEKEVLAVVFAVKKFHQYLYGRQFAILTDINHSLACWTNPMQYHQ